MTKEFILIIIKSFDSFTISMLTVDWEIIFEPNQKELLSVIYHLLQLVLKVNFDEC